MLNYCNVIQYARFPDVFWEINLVKNFVLNLQGNFKNRLQNYETFFFC